MISQRKNNDFLTTATAGRSCDKFQLEVVCMHGLNWVLSYQLFCSLPEISCNKQKQQQMKKRSGESEFFSAYSSTTASYSPYSGGNF